MIGIFEYMLKVRVMTNVAVNKAEVSYFGTDGIRGKFGEYPIHPEFLIKLGYATGKVLIDNQNLETARLNTVSPRPSVVIGKDTRLSGYVIEACLEAGFNAAGVDVHLLGVLPTPAIAHLTRSFHANAGVVISASHNPFFDNGVKFFSAEGKKLSDTTQQAINDKLATLENSLLPIDDPAALGKSYRVEDARGRYIEFCKGTFPYQLNLSQLSIVLDCANGAAYDTAPRVLRELGANVTVLANTPNGMNINENCGSTHPENLQRTVVAMGADLGIALDGDSDRIIMVDETGKLVDGDAILYILATQTAKTAGVAQQSQPNQTKLGVVGTLMSNMGLQLALEQQGIDFIRAKVGDRYVMQSLDDKGWTLGGEPSGHILCLDKSTTGDAIVAGLQVLSVMAYTQRSLSDLASGFTQLPQKLVNVRLAQQRDPYNFPLLAEKFQQAENQLAGRGRLLIRQSGTEPLIRIMVESDDEIECDMLANNLAAAVREQMA